MMTFSDAGQMPQSSVLSGNADVTDAIFLNTAKPQKEIIHITCFL